MFKQFLKIEINRTVLRWQTLLAFILFMTIFIHISIMNKADIPTVSSFPMFMFVISLCSMALCILSLVSGILAKNIFVSIAMPWLFYLIFGQLLMIIAPQTSIIYNLSPITMFGLFIFEDTFNFNHVIVYWLLLGIIFSTISNFLFQKKFNLKNL